MDEIRHFEEVRKEARVKMNWGHPLEDIEYMLFVSGLEKEQIQTIRDEIRDEIRVQHRQKGKRDLRRGVSLIGVGILPFIPSLQAGLVVLGAVGFVWGTWTLLSGIFILTNQNYRNSNSTPNQ